MCGGDAVLSREGAPRDAPRNVGMLPSEIVDQHRGILEAEGPIALEQFHIRVSDGRSDALESLKFRFEPNSVIRSADVAHLMKEGLDQLGTR